MIAAESLPNNDRCLQSHALATAVSADITSLAFSRHATVLSKKKQLMLNKASVYGPGVAKQIVFAWSYFSIFFA
jgi:hypothetical protein